MSLCINKGIKQLSFNTKIDLKKKTEQSSFIGKNNNNILLFER